MNRGYGKVQNAILRYFDENPDARSPITEIAGVMLGKELISPAEYESFRRGLNSLLAEGRLRKRPDRTRYGDYWYSTPEVYVEDVSKVQELLGVVAGKGSETG